MAVKKRKTVISARKARLKMLNRYGISDEPTPSSYKARKRMIERHTNSHDD